MWGPNRKPTSRTFNTRWLTLFFVTLGIYVATIALAITNTSEFSNEIETTRVRQSVNYAINTLTEDMARNGDNNSHWDDAALAIYGKKLDERFAQSTWGAATKSGTYFDSFAAVGTNQKALIAFEKGNRTNFDAHSPIAKAAQVLAAKLSRKSDKAYGMVMARGGPTMIAVTLIQPTSASLRNLIPKSGYSYAVFSKPLTQSALSQIAAPLQLPQISLVPASQSPNSVAITDYRGSIIAAAKWPPLGSRWAALARILPWISLLMALNVALTGYLFRSGMSRVADLGNQATVDQLSGLGNRRALRHALAAAEQGKEMIALAMVDLDGFKRINDTYGHDVGDELIKASSHLLTQRMEDDMLAVRLGGDEFAILIRGTDAARKLELGARFALKRMQQPVHIGARALQIGASFGLVEADLSEIDAHEAMRRADVAMYASKRAGKRCFTWFAPWHDEAHAEEKALARDLAEGIQKREFSVVYQPVFSASHRKIEAVEALLRWTSETRGAVPPATFIPIADKTGLITPISHQLLEFLSTDCMNWGEVRVAINMTAAHMRQMDFIDSLKKSLTTIGLPPERIEIEMSETLFLADRDLALEIARQLKALGIALSLDDFGSGASALNALREGGFSTVKLDRELVAQSEHDPVALATLQSGIAVAHALGIKVVAEGVETEAQAELMRVAGCDQLQGWLFGQALSGPTMSRLVNKQSKAARAAA